MASGNTVVSFTLRAIDRASSAIRRIGSAVAGVAKGLLSQGANIQGWVSLFQGAAGRIQGVFAGLWGAIRESFKFETLTGQFRTLLGSTEAAEERMAMLARVAEETPFDLEGVVKANRTLSVMSGDALGTREALLLVGDTAAATGGQVEELAFWVGRAYAMIKGGQPFGEAAMRLSELGAITPEVRQKMEALQAAGAGSAEVWQVLQEHLQTFSGAMAHLAQTGDGLTATLGDTWSASVRQFGDAFQGAAKDGIEFLIKLLQKLQADGTIQRWAEAAVKALTPVKNLIQAVLGGDGETRGEALKAAWDYLKRVFDYGAGVMKAAGMEMARSILGVAPALVNFVGKYTGAQWITSKITGVSMEDIQEDTRRMFTEMLGEGSFAEDMEAAGKAFAEASEAFAQTITTLSERAKARAEEAAAPAQAPLPDDGGLTKATEDLKAADTRRGPSYGVLKAQAEGELAKARAENVRAIKDILARRKQIAQEEADEEKEEARKREVADKEAAEDEAEAKAEASQAAVEAARARSEAARAELEEWRRRARDPDYDKSIRDEEKKRARENRRMRARVARLAKRFATRQDPNAFFRSNFDVGKLSRRDFTLWRAVQAELQAKQAAEAERKANEAAQKAVEELRQIRADLKRLLTQA